jgi:ubiquinol-cytochrome c reductase cytochrome b subunit
VTASVGLGIFALFSGYVIRYDGTGQAAGTIAEHLMLSVPFVGKALDRLLLGISNDGMNRIYAVHILMGALCWGIGTWYHTRRVVMPASAFLTALALLATFSLFVHAPLDVLSSDMHLIKGPWFFLAIQEMLRGIEPFWAGIVFPAIPILAVGLLPWIRHRRWIAALMIVWCACYIVASITAIMRS